MKRRYWHCPGFDFRWRVLDDNEYAFSRFASPFHCKKGTSRWLEEPTLDGGCDPAFEECRVTQGEPRIDEGHSLESSLESPARAIEVVGSLEYPWKQQEVGDSTHSAGENPSGQTEGNDREPAPKRVFRRS